MFSASLISDLARGMEYLHNTAGVAHGNLRSSNCLVDTRWVLQISGFGLRRLRGERSMCAKLYCLPKSGKNKEISWNSSRRGGSVCT